MLKILRHLFLPHHTNNHRAKLLHHQSIVWIIVFLLGLTFVLPPLQRQYPSVLGITVNMSVGELLSLTNQKRQEAGLAPLNLSPELSNAASAKASYMIEKNFWAHIAPDGTTPWYFIRNSGYQYQYAGENLARGFNSAGEVVDAWMASPTHRENLLSPNYKDIGFAITSGTLTGVETVLVVQEFGSKYVAEQSSVASNQAPVVTNVPVAAQIPVATQAPIVTIVPSPVASSATPQVATRLEAKPQTVVAAAVNKPLVDSKSASHNLSIFILGLFIVLFVVDAIVIEKKQIARMVTHNLDHIVFLAILLMAAIIIGKGVVL